MGRALRRSEPEQGIEATPIHARRIVCEYVNERAEVTDADYVSPYAYLSDAPAECMSDPSRMRSWLSYYEPDLLNSETEALRAARVREWQALIARVREKDPKALIKLSIVAAFIEGEGECG